ncbi:MAG TPA: HNH endonuclease signature motif containing protein [Bdellovibrionota bacterium]|jgi:hypothetical protein
MGSLPSYSDAELENGLRLLVSREKEIIHEVVLHVQEVDRRKLYLTRARQSLFDYLTLDFGYSASSAQRRIDAARLASELPASLEMIKSGTLQLSQITVLQKAARQKKNVPLQEKQAVLSKIEGASFRKTEQIIAESFGLPTIEKTKITPQSNQTFRIALTISQETWSKLERCREILAHKNPSGSLPEIVDLISDHFLKNKDPLTQPLSTASVVPPQQNTAAIPVRIRRLIFRRDKSCQYKDPISKRMCGSRFLLEIDHIKMRCRGGSHHPANLRLLCRAHNQLVAREKLGANFIDSKLSR